VSASTLTLLVSDSDVLGHILVLAVFFNKLDFHLLPSDEQ